MTPVSPHGAAGQQTQPCPPPVIWPLISWYLIRRYHMGAVTFRYYDVLTIATSPAMTPVSPQGAAGKQTQPPLPHSPTHGAGLGPVIDPVAVSVFG